jgi:hypothetical protein
MLEFASSLTFSAFNEAPRFAKFAVSHINHINCPEPQRPPPLHLQLRLKWADRADAKSLADRQSRMICITVSNTWRKT